MLTYLAPIPGSTRVEWPTDTSPADSALLVSTRVVAADSSGGLEFPHRSVQEYFAAVAVHIELAREAPAQVEPSRAAAPRVGGGVRSALDLWQKWFDAKRGGTPREVVLTMALSDDPLDDARRRILTCRDWNVNGFSVHDLRDVRARLSFASPPASETVITAVCDPANDVLRILASALFCRPLATPAMCDRLISSMAAGCEAAALCDFLGDCLPLLPANIAAELLCRENFERAATTVWDLAHVLPVSKVRLLGHKFWSAVDAVTSSGQAVDAAASCGQARRAIAIIRAALSSPGSSESSSDDAVSRACVAAAVLGCLSRISSPEVLAEAHAVLEAASASSFTDLAAEAVFARPLLDPLPGSEASAVDMRERLLRLVRPTSHNPDHNVVCRAAQELALRFPSDSVVHAALKADAERGSLTPFVAACTSSYGLSLVSPEIACTLFQWFEPVESTRLSMLMWDPLGSARDAVEERLTPLHIAASRLRADFIAVYLGVQDIDVNGVVNALSVMGWSPLSIACTRTVEADPSSAVECALTLIASGAAWGAAVPRADNALHYAAATGSIDAVRSLLSAPGANRGILNAINKVCMEEDGYHCGMYAQLAAGNARLPSDASPLPVTSPVLGHPCRLLPAARLNPFAHSGRKGPLVYRHPPPCEPTCKRQLQGQGECAVWARHGPL